MTSLSRLLGLAIYGIFMNHPPVFWYCTHICACFYARFRKCGLHPFHPSISCFFFQFLGHRGLLEPIPAVKGREAGYTLDRSPAYHRFRLINSPNMYLEKGRKPECPEKTHTCTGNSTQEGQNRDLNPKPSYCEATVLTTAPSWPPSKRLCANVKRAGLPACFLPLIKVIQPQNNRTSTISIVTPEHQQNLIVRSPRRTWKAIWRTSSVFAGRQRIVTPMTYSLKSMVPSPFLTEDQAVRR